MTPTPGHESAGPTPEPPRNREAPPAGPLRLLILGDFGARWHRVLNEPLAGRPVYEVFPGNLPDVLGSYGANLTLPLTGELNDLARLSLRSLQDFHPDALLAKVPSLADLLALRTQPAATVVEQEVSARLRSLLHDPDFQALEATWRGLDFLIRRCPDHQRVQHWVLDASLEEIAADPAGLQRLLRRQPCQVVIGLFTFGETAADLATLATLGTMVGAQGARLLAGAHPQLVGCASFDTQANPATWSAGPPAAVRPAWDQLRASAAARHIGLVLPRFLLRPPYGAESSPIESFEFEEMTGDASHEAFLWGNSALLCGHLLATHQATGRLAGSGTVTGLQPGRYLRNNAPVTKPCGEVSLGEPAIERILRSGLIPVQSTGESDSVRLPAWITIDHSAPA